MPETTTLAERLIAALPERVTLGYVHYDDQISDERIQQVLDGDRLAVENDLSDMWFEDRCRNEREEIIEALQSLGDDAPDIDDLDPEVIEQVQQALWDRDDFDAFESLLRITPGRMFRLAVREPEDCDTPLATQVDWSSTPEETLEDAVRISEALGWGGEHTDFIVGILNEANDIDSQVFILWHGDVAPVIEAVTAQTFEVVAQHTITFSADSAGLLIFGRWNGSGYVDQPLPAEVKLPFLADWVDLDHKAGPGYSFSDDVAGLVYSAFSSDPAIDPVAVPAE